ncbi:hypothetical protein OG897_06255 [Streptomyces sp. NBC_00237]|nr:hypothetical protein [Streptomyces sp. NBC_00237]MCX5201064.1 hypothetical protein [Streptomyces sp. NBC_00237]
MIYLALAAGIIAAVIAYASRSAERRELALGAALLALLIALMYGGQW